MDTTKEKTSRFDDAEYGIMKSLFKDTDELLYLIRKIFLFGGLSENEVKQAEVFKKDDVFNVLKKVFIPEIIETDPYNNVMDTWLTLDLKDKMPEEIEVNIQARQRTNKMMDEAVDRLKNPPTEKITVLEFIVEQHEDDENHTALLARNNFISGVSYQLSNLKIMSKKQNDTNEEILKKLKKNSSR